MPHGRRIIIATLALGCAAASAPQPSGSTTGRFARSLVTLARQEQTRNAAAFARLTGIALRNPNKWDDQSEEGRTATWRGLRNHAGVSEVTFSEFAGGFFAQLKLTGRPCLRIAQFEDAAGTKASRGGIAFSVVYDAPPPPIELGDEHATLDVEGRGGTVTSIAMRATDAGPRGCLEWIGLQSSRDPPRSG